MGYYDKLEEQRYDILKRIEEQGLPYLTKLKNERDVIEKIVGYTKKTVRLNKVKKKLKLADDFYKREKYEVEVTPEKVNLRHYIFNNMEVTITHALNKRIEEQLDNFAEVTHVYGNNK